MLVPEDISLLDDENTLMYKVLLIGDTGVGKSSILSRYTQDLFSETFISTVGMDFATKIIRNDKQLKAIKQSDNKYYRLTIWDTAGQERFDSITSSYYRGANGIALCFDLTDHTSFDNVKNWFDKIIKYADSEVSIIIVGTKRDMILKRCIDREAIRELSAKYNTSYIETSSKTGENMDELFMTLLKTMMRKSRNTGTNRLLMRSVEVNDRELSCKC